jgi:CRP/FNR family transcriptional regulator, anaerobic regulatory protein
MKEGQFALSPVSFFGQQPSFEFLQLLEDCTLNSITHKQLQQLYVEFPEFNKVGRLLVEQYYIRSELRTHQMRSLSAAERYALCQSTYGAMLNRVSNDHLASFIGLTPETLSRVKSKKL